MSSRPAWAKKGDAVQEKKERKKEMKKGKGRGK
jgi:hypothetical protein